VDEVYDLQADPGERVNLHGAPTLTSTLLMAMWDREVSRQPRVR
jgi:hypothetical protein